MTTAQDGGKVVSLTHRLPLSPGNAPGTHFYQISYNIKILTLIPLCSSIKIKLVEVNYIEY